MQVGEGEKGDYSKAPGRSRPAFSGWGKFACEVTEGLGHGGCAVIYLWQQQTHTCLKRLWFTEQGRSGK